MRYSLDILQNLLTRYIIRIFILHILFSLYYISHMFDSMGCTGVNIFFNGFYLFREVVACRLQTSKRAFGQAASAIIGLI